ncbi:uncharacterized protein LOC123261501 [Cotesia glomerata]|uniref:Uncharacterized protein n=1 Tax=Cotesia glomerata TaxID=32391 RepID=A0AAV7ID36_COTGL|nr:uncharacterized protein LOC123261501 [Cotesia glomerata]KAH0549111.1 hypothetical protein KQX54_006177 [Cotesia glomerata]
MESFKINLALIFFFIAFASAINKPDPEEYRFSYICYENSVVVSFEQQLPYEVHLYTVSSDKNESECSRIFTPNEPAVKELNFKSCSYAARKFQVYVDEQYGRSLKQHFFLVNCQVPEFQREISIWKKLLQMFKLYKK